LRQINAVYFHPRNEDGTLDRAAAGGAPVNTYEDDFRGVWAARGLSPDKIDVLWQHFLFHEAAKQQAGARAGILTMSGAVVSHERNQALEEEWAGIWRETARRILNHA